GDRRPARPPRSQSRRDDWRRLRDVCPSGALDRGPVPAADHLHRAEQHLLRHLEVGDAEPRPPLGEARDLPRDGPDRSRDRLCRPGEGARRARRARREAGRAARGARRVPRVRGPVARGRRDRPRLQGDAVIKTGGEWVVEALQAVPNRIECFRPVTRWAEAVTEAGAIARTLSGGFDLLRTGRPGPIAVSIPNDFLFARVEGERPAGGYGRRPPCHVADIAEAA